MNVLVRPEVREEDFTGIRSDVCKGVKDVTVWKGDILNFVVARTMRVTRWHDIREVLRWNRRWRKLPPINAPR